MDFQSSGHLDGIEDEDENCITMDADVHSGSGLELNVSVAESETNLELNGSENGVMAYLLPSETVELPGGDSVDLSQPSMFIAMPQEDEQQEEQLVVPADKQMTDESNSGLINDADCDTTDTQQGEITILNLNTDQVASPASSRSSNSMVQLTSDGKVNIVSREMVPQIQLHQVMLPDGSVAYLNGNQADNLHAVRLDDGSIAYLTASIIPEGGAIDTSTITLEQTDKSQVSDVDEEDTENKSAIKATVVSQTEESSDWTPVLKMDEAQLPGILQPTPSPTPSITTKVKDSPLSLGGSTYKCHFEGCSRVYTTVHHLKVHQCTHTGDKPFQCEVSGCEKSFTTAYSLKSHMRVHTGEKPYKCPMDECNKAFKTSGDLQKHVRTHTGEKPFTCPFEGCGKSFTTSNIRKVHIRVHTGERPYVCPMDGCGKSFSSATNYKNHVRIHTGERPYVCTVTGCGKRFTEYSSLYKHHIVHTHSKPYLCVHCGKTYRQASTLSMHKRTAHNDDSEATEAELVLAPATQVFAIPSQASEDSDGALVINTVESNKTSSAQAAAATTPTAAISITTVTSSAPAGSTANSVVLNAAGSAISVIQGAPSNIRSVKLPLEMEQQKVFLISDPSQLQLLQQYAQPLQVLNPAESIAEGVSTEPGTASQSLNSK